MAYIGIASNWKRFADEEVWASSSAKVMAYGEDGARVGLCSNVHACRSPTSGKGAIEAASVTATRAGSLRSFPQDSWRSYAEKSANSGKLLALMF